MCKRIMCCLLAALLILGMLPGVALPTAAAENMTTSEPCIEILKEMEGFLEYAVADNGQYTIGYGTSCGPNDYPNGITEEEADALLREHMARFEVSVNRFLQKYNLVLPQNQFDALMLFTYNCGSGWVNSDGTFRRAVIEGKTGNEFLYAITLWSNASAQLHMGLLTRRLIEADMYLNGSYTNKKPSNYSYVILDSNGGAADSKAQGYDCNLTARILAEPTRSGYRFLGWYSAEEGGAWITELTPANMEQTIYAHWQDAQAQGVVENAASYMLTTGELESLNYYNQPGGEAAGTLNASTVVSIVADYVDGSGMKWGKTSDGKWVRLGDPRVGAQQQEEEETGIEVTVTGSAVNVRSGPGTNYRVVASVNRGDKLIITETRMVGNMLWGKFRAGWLSLQYTTYKGGLTPDESTPLPDPEEDEPIATGTITANMLNIRATPSASGYLMGCYKQGDKVTIYERSIVGGVAWGRTDKGWINLNYVQLDTAATEPSTDPSTEPSVPSEEPTTPPATQPSTPPQEPEIPQQPQDGMWGTVTASALIIRKTPGGQTTNSSYPKNERILILEQQLHQGILWGRTDKGWVSMAYVKLDPNSADNDAGVQGTVTASTLNIRKGPGTGYGSVGAYGRGDRIVILEIQANGKTNWGRTDRGWVSMQYVTLEANAPVEPTEPKPTEPAPTEPVPTVPAPTEPAPTEPPATEPEATEPVTPPTGVTCGTITASGLNVRASASTGAVIVAYYTRGDRVQILEQKLVNGTVWGRTDKGWISMNYVQLDLDANGGAAAGFTGTTTASTLCIRSAPGTGSAILGSYPRGSVVTILETRQVGNTTWGRTDKGWISMDYVK